MVNKASKFWQENWEAHADFSEQKVLGPLYRLTFPASNRQDLFSLTERYSASVSRINIYISVVIIVFWLSMLLDFCYQNLSIAKSIASIDIYYTGLLLFTSYSCYFLLFKTGSDLEKSSSKFILRD
jgi:hypothetical protein